jgi:hydroxypyruvate isomerase
MISRKAVWPAMLPEAWARGNAISQREDSNVDSKLQYTVNCSFLFTELPMLERPAAAKAAGFDAVEFGWPFPDVVPADSEVDAFVAAVENAGVRLTELNFAAGDMGAGERGLVSLPARSKDFRSNVEVVVAIGRRLGTRMFNALYGNRSDEYTAAEQDELANENLAVAAHAAASAGAVVLVEAMSGAPKYPVRTATDAIGVIERVEIASGARNIRFLADLYHLTVNGDDVGAAIARYGARIGHVQIADVPGRHEPGTGNLDLERCLSDLVGVGYHGLVGLEYTPSTSTEDSFDWLPRRPVGISDGRHRGPVVRAIDRTVS